MNTLEQVRRILGAQWGVPWRSVRVRVTQRLDPWDAHLWERRLIIGLQGIPRTKGWEAFGVSRRCLLQDIVEWPERWTRPTMDRR